MGLEVLVPDDRDTIPLPDAIRQRYGGGLGFAKTALYANFVQSLDGVVSVDGSASSGSQLSGKSDDDRFVMGLLRACADAVFMGAGTLRQTPGHRWTAGFIYPALQAEWAELREALGKPPEPLLAVVTNSGEIDVEHPAIQAGALVLTTEVGERRLAPRLPATCELVSWEAERLDLSAALRFLRDRGHHLLLSEAGPTITAQLLDARLLDELFLTTSPITAGRVEKSWRPGFVDGAAFLPEHVIRARLLSLRRAGDYLFARYTYR